MSGIIFRRKYGAKICLNLVHVLLPSFSYCVSLFSIEWPEIPSFLQNIVFDSGPGSENFTNSISDPNPGWNGWLQLEFGLWLSNPEKNFHVCFLSKLWNKLYFTFRLRDKNDTIWNQCRYWNASLLMPPLAGKPPSMFSVFKHQLCIVFHYSMSMTSTKVILHQIKSKNKPQYNGEKIFFCCMRTQPPLTCKAVYVTGVLILNW